MLASSSIWRKSRVLPHPTPALFPFGSISLLNYTILDQPWSSGSEVRSVQFSSVAQLHLTLCDPTGCRMPGFPVLHHLPEFAHTRVHRVEDAVQPPAIKAMK